MSPGKRVAGRGVGSVVNTNPDIVRVLRTAIEEAGFIVVSAHIEDIKTGAVDLQAFLRDHPRVLVNDIAPPYDQNWSFLEHIKATLVSRGGTSSLPP